MSKKIILSLFILGLINVPALAKEPVQTIKLEENTIDFNLEDLTTEIKKTQEVTNLEFDESSDPLPEIQKTVEEKTKEISNSINEKIDKVSNAIENTQETVQQKVEEQIEATKNILDSNPDEITDIIEAIEEAEKLIKSKETLEKEIEQKDNELKETQELLQKQTEQKIEEIENAKEVLEEQLEQKTEELKDTQEVLKEQAKTQIEEIQKTKETLDKQIKQQVEEVKGAKKVLKQQLEQQTEELKQIKDEKIEEVKSILNEKPAISETSQLRPLAPIIDLSSTKPKTEIEDDSTDAIKLTTPDNAQSKTTSTTVAIDAPKWEDFCETGYENASTKDRENLLNIINFVNAERIKSNYWAERRESFEKAITHCNSLEENSRSYCYESVRKSENEKNEMYEQQRKQVNYKNQGIKIDK